MQGPAIHGMKRNWVCRAPAWPQSLPAIVADEAAGAALKHDPEKWVPVFRKRSCSDKSIERDDASMKSHHAFSARLRSFGSNEVSVAILVVAFLAEQAELRRI